MNINFNRLVDKSVPFLLLIFVIAIVLVSMGRSARWDLLDQIAMADNYLTNGNLYSEFGSENFHGHTVYFPGVAYLAVALKTLGIENFLVEVMLLLAVIILLLFIYVLACYGRLFSRNEFSTRFFYIIFISYLIVALPVYLKYALEFKPDTIALLLGYGGVLLVVKNRIESAKFYIGIISISLAILFKQQFIAFQVGILCAAFLVEKRSFLFAALTSTIFSALILYGLLSDEHIRYWSIQILSDDGMLTAKRVILDCILLSGSIFLSILILLLGLNYSDSRQWKISTLSWENIKSLSRNPWYVITFFVVGASLISSIKVGGNIGNSQLALAVVLPLVGLIAKFLHERRLILLAWFGLMSFLHQELPTSIRQYASALELKYETKKLESDEPMEILTGSDVYYASRCLIREGINLDNYWVEALIDNGDPHEGLVTILESKKYDYLIIENFIDNFRSLHESDDYEILFVNSLGIIAKSIKN